jgi:hypothetical protein
MPLPGHLILALLQGLERMPWQLPVSSENLLGLKALVAEDTRGDLARAGLVLTPFEDQRGNPSAGGCRGSVGRIR